MLWRLAFFPTRLFAPLNATSSFLYLTVQLEFKLIWLKGVLLNWRRISKLRKLYQGISQVLLPITIYTHKDIFILINGQFSTKTNVTKNSSTENQINNNKGCKLKSLRKITRRFVFLMRWAYNLHLQYQCILADMWWNKQFSSQGSIFLIEIFVKIMYSS